jgi:8-oxo-dGTP pyrophosphatase MutT (NUDIX family)
MRKRSTAVIVNKGKILIFRRVKPGQVYYVIPGGGVDLGETVEQALKREVKEELSLDVQESTFLYMSTSSGGVPNGIHVNEPQENYFYLVSKYIGVPELGGPEKEQSNSDNQYHLEWVPIEDLVRLNPYPSESLEKLVGIIS